MQGNRYPVRAWDLGVRVFHWSLLVLLTGLWLTGESEGDWMEVHQWLGISALALVLSRIAWGFVGSETARFGHFIRGRGAVVTYLRGVFHFVSNTTGQATTRPAAGQCCCCWVCLAPRL